MVQTDRGAIRGASSDGVDSFLGIPYAAPPIANLRWQAPQPHAPWSGVLPTTSYGARCAALESTNGVRTNAEDCLFINVQRATGVTAGRKIPVYVFIHGGGLVNGSSNQAGGEKIVRLSNAIVVTMNYRLGVFGFLGLPGLSKTGQGNYGFLDQQAALRWVQRNIAAFGGDPNEVTLGGESAGAFSVCAHLTAPGSQGLFSRAMMQSGSCLSRPLAATRTDSTTFAAAAGCPSAATETSCLRGLSAAKLLDASTGFSPTLTSGTTALPQPPATAVRDGEFARVPIVTGSNRDEGRTFFQGDIGLTESQYEAWVQSTFPALAPQVLARYPWPRNADKFTPAYLIGAIATDSGLAAGIGGCSQLQLESTFAKYVPTYAYEFDARHGPGLVPIPGYVWGAGHAAELAYLFPSFNNGTPIAPTFNAGERQLSRDMIHYWGGFVFRGSPNAQGQAHWPKFGATHRIMSLKPSGESTEISTSAFRSEHQCGFWDSVA
ncbi:carboxylesterase/lipase family protein [Jatrophihabitans sp. GAS493]|uniref:carboxylesterase/lipase family protein n=1 Tax=Jatrophihabitans sp. GAS493 TaxID=1907575 RepID=UPI0018D52F44|nr:carboxylesterase family protein [Jatrophihabitans sp. GAS493]